MNTISYIFIIILNICFFEHNNDWRNMTSFVFPYHGSHSCQFYILFISYLRVVTTRKTIVSCKSILPMIQCKLCHSHNLSQVVQNTFVLTSHWSKLTRLCSFPMRYTYSQTICPRMTNFSLSY